jgi:uncharacterized zinc-type alcohol dehydrogenase-like protein
MYVKSIAAHDSKGPLKVTEIERRSPRPDDVVIEIQYCGICHSDIHTARSEWGPAHYPCVPGHEIVGKVVETGKRVKGFRKGDWVGVGCFVDSCKKCENCKNNEEQFCSKTVFTYNSKELDGITPTFGGYSTHIVVRDKFVLKLKKGLAYDRVAPLLCAGITTYSPLKRAKLKRGQKLGVIGLGGLGHMAVKFGKALGAEVTVFSTSPGKKDDAKKLGAKHFVISTDSSEMEKLGGRFDVLIDTVSAKHDLAPYMNTLKVGGQLILVGAAPEPLDLSAFAVIFGRKSVTGSLIGGIRETQQMLDLCAKKKIYSDIELIKPEQVNEAFERTLKAQVKYRFVMDMKAI